MKTEIIQSLTNSFEEQTQRTDTGVEYWFGRSLQHLLGYGRWENFQNVLVKAKTACEGARHKVSDHFVDVHKMVSMPNGGEKITPDLMLTRFACYLVAQNGDPKKREIAFAQTYFAVQTRKSELIEQRLLEAERVAARKKLTVSEKALSQTIFEQTGDTQSFALIRSKGDTALFGRSTQAMKAQWQVPESRPLADFAPTIILKAKDFATEITNFNARQHAMRDERAISNEHITNNEAVRNTLIERGIRPESLAPVEDVKKVERRLSAGDKQVQTKTESLPRN